MSSLTIEEREHQGSIILTLTGRIEGKASRDLHKRLLGHVAKNQLRILLDLSGLDAIAGAGLRVIVATAERLDSRGGALALCNLRPSVRRVLDMAGMDRLEIFADRAEAWYWLEETVRRQRIAIMAARLLRREDEAVQRYAPTQVDVERLRLALRLLQPDSATVD